MNLSVLLSSNYVVPFTLLKYLKARSTSNNSHITTQTCILLMYLNIYNQYFTLSEH